MLRSPSMLRRLELAESALKVVGGLSVLALLGILAWPRPTPRGEVDVKPAVDVHPARTPLTCGDVRNGCLRCCPGAECPCPNPNGPNVAYACLSGEPDRIDGVCLSRNYARADGKLYACWSCSPIGDRTVEPQE